ncbi:MAG: diguanylate cyclase [Pseudomonadota bacterium]
MRLNSGPWVWLVLASLAYFATAKLGMALFAVSPSNITLLWLPSGIGLVMALHGGVRALPLIFTASFAANFSGMALPELGQHFLHVGIAAGADTLAPSLGALMLQRWLPHGLQRLTDLFNFVLFVCVIPTLVSSLILTFNLVLGGYIESAAFLDFVTMLLLADGLGILVVYPLYMAWMGEKSFSVHEGWSFLGAQALIVLMIYLSFTHAPYLIFFILPGLLYLVFTCSTLIVGVALAITVMTLAAFSSLGPGAFSGELDANWHRMLIAFLFATTLSVLGVLLQHRELMSEKGQVIEWQNRAMRDPLTGLVNRLLLYPLIENEFERVRRNEAHYEFALAMLDIDHFKEVNDCYGHVVGDEVLRVITSRINHNLRGMDVASRYGGEEFAILFPNSSLDDAWQALERLRIEMETTPVMVSGRAIPVTISGGVAAFCAEDTPCTPDALIARADKLLYLSKRNGRNRITA